MKKIVLLLCFFVLSKGIEAQPVNLGLRGGLAIPNIVAGSENALSDGYSSRFAGSGGIFTEIGINNTFSVRFGVEYSGQGGKRNGIQAMSSNQLVMDMATRMGANITEETAAMLGEMATLMPPVFYADVNNTVKFDYLMLPLSLQAGKTLGDSPYRIYVNAGPFVSFLMSGEQVSKGSSKLYSGADKTGTLWTTLPSDIQSNILEKAPELAHVLENGTEFGASVITGEIRPVNFGIQGNIGLSYQCGKHNRFFIEAGGNYGFVRIQKNKSNGDNSIGSANIVIGYSFRIVAL
ncbi:MAG: PorT family protein [Prevotellaceae bacterium]|nr:PorT family protein [Prevotellaceae bacterium]